MRKAVSRLILAAAGASGEGAELRDLRLDRGRIDSVDAFMRLYMLPGRYHCAGTGPAGVQSIDSMKIIVDWVEKGLAPEAVDGVLKEGGTRPVAPYRVTRHDEAFRMVRAWAIREPLASDHRPVALVVER